MGLELRGVFGGEEMGVEESGVYGEGCGGEWGVSVVGVINGEVVGRWCLEVLF